MPADNSEGAAGDAQRAGFVKRYNYVGTGQGTVVRVTEFAPGDYVVATVCRPGVRPQSDGFPFARRALAST